MGNSGSPGRSTTLDTQPMETLIAALLSEDCLEQADAARFLGEIGRREAVPPLVKYVVECRNYAKVAGIEALARIRDASACPPCGGWWSGPTSPTTGTGTAIGACGPPRR